jgi:hypothetical protein
MPNIRTHLQLLIAVVHCVNSFGLASALRYHPLQLAVIVVVAAVVAVAVAVIVHKLPFQFRLNSTSCCEPVNCRVTNGKSL